VADQWCLSDWRRHGVSNQKGTTDQPQPRWIQLELEFKD